MADPVSIGLMVGGTLLSAVSSVQQGQAQQRMANYQAQQAQQVADAQAKQLEYQAGQERAAAQQRLAEVNRQRDITQSRTQALAAAGGGGSLDPSVINLLGDLGMQAEYEKGTILYEGEEAAKGQEYQAALTRQSGQAQAAVDRFSGRLAKRAGYMQAASSIMSTGTSLYDKYSGGLYGGGQTTLRSGERINWYPNTYR